MNEAIAATNLLEKDEVSGTIEKASIIAGRVPLKNEDKAQRIVLDEVESTVP